MNVVYISPNFPPNYVQFSIGLRNLGVNVLGIGDTPYEYLSNDLKYALTEYYKVDWLESYEQLLSAVAFFTHKYGKIDRICSLNEHWLEKEAMLRTDFNVFGTKIDQIASIKRKSLMKEKFKEAGISVAQGDLVDNIEGARRFIKKVGYPVVLKPDNGVGAAGTRRINNDNELKTFFSKKLDTTYIMEEFIDGDLYSFDGLVNRDGKVVFYTSHFFSTGIMESVNQGQSLFYYSLRDIPKDIEEAGLASVKTFGVRETFFHIEYFRAKRDQELIGLEVNMRPPGGLTTDMFNYANDIDIYQEWANVVVNNNFESDYVRKYHCCYIGRKDFISYKHSRQEIIDKYDRFIVHEGFIPDILSAAIGNYAFLVRSEELKKVLEIAKFVLAQGD